MNIAILTSVHPPLDGRIFYKQVLSLAKAGHSITYVAPYDPQAVVIAQQHQIKYIPLMPGQNRRVARMKRWLQIMELLRKNQFDVWHFHDPELLPLSVIWKSIFAPDTHLLYDVHEDIPKNIMDKLWIPSWLRWWVAQISERIEYWGAKRCSAVIAATEPIEKRLRRAIHQTVTVHNYPLAKINVAPRKESIHNDNLRVVYVGGLTPSRGIQEIVLAMTHLVNEKCTLVLLGDFWPASFEQEIRNIAGNNVEIVNKIPFTQVATFLSTCDIGIVCLHATPAYIESLPIKLFEYMQSSLPVIASDFPSWRHIIEDANCGLLVDPMDIQQIAAAIQILIKDQDKRIKMGQAGQKAVNEHYTWQTEERLLLNVYQHLSATKV